MNKNVNIPKHQRVGLIVLATILFVLLCVKVSIKRYYVPKSSLTAYELPISKDSVSVQKEPSEATAPSVDITGVTIDIQTAPYDSLILVGIPKYPARNIVKYRSKGGKIYSAEKLQKIYGMTPEIFDKVSSYIRFTRKRKVREERPAKKKPRSHKKQYVTRSESTHPPVATTVEGSKQKWKRKKDTTFRNYIPDIVDVNTADTAELKKLRGIGSYLAKNIVWYRNKLGGYHSLHQLQEVRHLRKSTYEKILPFIKLSTKEVKKIEINTQSHTELARHPYISRKTARILTNYRNNNGKYTQAKDLLKTRVLTEDDLKKLLPYLAF